MMMKEMNNKKKIKLKRIDTTFYFFFFVLCAMFANCHSVGLAHGIPYIQIQNEMCNGFYNSFVEFQIYWRWVNFRSVAHGPGYIFRFVFCCCCVVHSVYVPLVCAHIFSAHTQYSIQLSCASAHTAFSDGFIATEKCLNFSIVMGFSLSDVISRKCFAVVFFSSSSLSYLLFSTCFMSRPRFVFLKNCCLKRELSFFFLRFATPFEW